MAAFQVEISLIKISNVLMTLLMVTKGQSFFPSSNSTNPVVISYTTLCNFVDYTPNSSIICVKGYPTNFTNENIRNVPFSFTNRTKRDILLEDETENKSDEELLFEINFNDTNKTKESSEESKEVRLDVQSIEDLEVNKPFEEPQSENIPDDQDPGSEENKKYSSKFIGILQIRAPHIIRPFYWSFAPQPPENANNHDFTNMGFRVPNFLAVPNLVWDRISRRGSALFSSAQNAIFGSGNIEEHDEYPAAYRKVMQSKMTNNHE